MAYFLQGKKTALRALTRDDLPQITKWVNDRNITQYLRMFRPMQLEGEEKWYESLVGSATKYVFAVMATDTEKHTFIGTMGVHGVDHRAQVASTGALIGEATFHGGGYGTDAKMQLLYWAFTELNLRKVTSSVLATNPRSKAYLEKTGYTEVGKYREHDLVNGVFVDEYIMEIFRDAFLKKWTAYNT